MVGNRELTFDDLLVIFRRRLLFVLVPGIAAALLGFGVSFAFTPKYTSRALLQVEGQVVPQNYVKPIVTERIDERMATLRENVLSRSRLQPLVARLGLARNGKTTDEAIDEIRQNLAIKEAAPISQSWGSSSRPTPGNSAVPGYYVTFSAGNPSDAHQVCSEITSMLLEDNLELRKAVAQSTTDFLAVQLEQAKRNLDEMDTKLSVFRHAHVGRLPSDVDTNLRILAGLDSQLEANTQAITRAQEDKAYAESLVNQDLAAWKAALAEPTGPSLRQQLIALQDRLVMLQARYTDSYPTIKKVKRDIAQVKKQLDDIDAKSDKESADQNVAKRLEPPDVQRLRQQIHNQEGIIERATAEEGRLKQQIAEYQDRLAVSPEVEEQWKQLTRDSATAHGIYDNLLTNKDTAEMQTEMERKQQGEQLRLLDAADIPSSPSYPVRWKFALGGLGGGLFLGVGVAAWLEIQDKRVRDEKDVWAAFELPTLGSVSWAGNNQA